MNALRKLYRVTVDHLTKVIGAIGLGIMSMSAWIDPQTVGAAASQYLGEHAYRKVGAVLFALVILRGWYSGRKFKQLNAPSPP